jgi:hypothetical protein
MTPRRRVTIADYLHCAVVVFLYLCIWALGAKEMDAS